MRTKSVRSILLATSYYAPQVLFAVAYKFALRFWPAETHEGIKTMDFDPTTRAAFTNRIHDALCLVATNDERRFKVVKREISSIANAPMPGGSKYIPLTRTCFLDFNVYDVPAHRSVAVQMLACHIIYYAVRGRIHRYGIIPTVDNLRRFHSVAHAEMTRFAERIRFSDRPWEIEWNPKHVSVPEARKIGSDAGKTVEEHRKKGGYSWWDR